MLINDLVKNYCDYLIFHITSYKIVSPNPRYIYNCHPVLPQFATPDATVHVVSTTLAGIIQSSDSHYTVTCDITTLEDNFIEITGTAV